MTTPDFTWTCYHCGQKCGDYEGGYGGITAKDGAIHATCHPNVPGRPDCYRRITVYGEPEGALRDVRPLPAGVKDIRKEPVQH